MPQKSVNSSNISLFRFGVQFDLYNRTVTFTDTSVYAGSSGTGIFGILGISFSLIDQDNVELATINFDDPTKFIAPYATRTFVVDLSSLSYAFLFQTYKIVGAIKDADSTIYYTDAVYKKICEPVNITESGYVPGTFQITPNCPDNVLTVKELTLFTYNNLAPVSKTKSGILYYPTGTIGQVSFTGTPFSNNAIYTGEYRVDATTVAEYDLLDDVSVLVTYLTNNVFPVTCANKIADLICCMVELQTTYLKNCNNATGKNAQQKLNDVVIPFMLGLTKEINGQDASNEAMLIRKTLNCDCGATSMRQNEFTPINPASTSIVLTGVGGTTIPSPTTIGNTKTYNIASSVYQVVKGVTGDLAFTISTDTSTANLVKYIITFNYNTMASYILNAIATDPALINLLNSLITSTGGADISGLDGKCVIDIGSNDYLVTQNITSATKVTALTTATTTFTAPVNLYANNSVSVASWLNGLGVGTFVVTGSGSIIGILSLNNTYQLASISFSSPDVTVILQSTNVTLVQALQAIIDYLCGLTALQSALGNTLTLWQIDYNGVPSSQGFSSTQSQAVFNQGIADSIYNLVQRMALLTGVTCEKVAAIFQDYPLLAIGSQSRVYGKDGSNCVSWTDKQLALGVIQAVQSYSDVKAAFCAIDCSVDGSCPDVADINMAMVGTGIGIYGLTWAAATLASQTVRVRYKLASTDVWTTATSSLVILPNGNISGTTPFVIPGLVAGQTYDVEIVNNCGGIGFIKQILTPTGSVIPASYRRDNIVYNICGSSPVTLYTTAPFAVGVTVYTNIGCTIPLTGYSLIADSTGEIYTINTSTGAVTADTGLSCTNGVEGSYILGDNTGTICGNLAAPRYTNGAFVVGGVLYKDAGLSEPVTGSSYVVNTANNHIYSLNTSTGIITGDTGLTCGSYSGSFKRDNSEGAICGVGDELLYSASVFAPGVVVYTDAGLTTPAISKQYIADSSGIIYNLNAVTGLVGLATGNAC
jgi:hypothetical protein